MIPFKDRLAKDAKFVVNDYFIIILISDFDLLLYDKRSLTCAIMITDPFDEKTKEVLETIITKNACDEYEGVFEE
jgi:hypothetical protein